MLTTCIQISLIKKISSAHFRTNYNRYVKICARDTIRVILNEYVHISSFGIFVLFIFALTLCKHVVAAYPHNYSIFILCHCDKTLLFAMLLVAIYCLLCIIHENCSHFANSMSTCLTSKYKQQQKLKKIEIC